MNSKQINKLYFEWLCGLVCEGSLEARLKCFKSLLTKLHKIVFTFSELFPMDANRLEDGTDLRYRFSYENNYDDRLIASFIDDKPCSVLEMLVALALRCEEHIMSDYDFGNRTGLWFWKMIENLGLDVMDEKKFDECFVDETVHAFMNREYERDGSGGNIFVVDDDLNLKNMEIWYQMNMYLRKYL